MNNETRAFFNDQFKKALAKQYGQEASQGEVFSVSPTIAQTMETKIQESSGFLTSINTTPVREMSGEKVGMDVTGPIARRTDTEAGHKRVPKDPTTLDARRYYCEEVEYDVMMKWSKWDSWRKDKSFFARFSNLTIQQQAHDIIMAGWNGQYTALETDPTENPMLQDLNVGWLQYLINHAPEKVKGLNTDGSIDVIKVGPGGDYENMDQLVYDLSHTLINKAFRGREDIRAIVGDELVLTENLRMYGNYEQPTEKKPLDMFISSMEYGRKKIVKAPHFPDRGVLLTPLKNLSRYWQLESRRRKIEDDHQLKAIVDFNFIRDDFVMEHIEAVAMVHPDAIHIPGKVSDGNGGFTEDWVPAAEAWKVEIPEG